MCANEMDYQSERNRNQNCLESEVVKKLENYPVSLQKIRQLRFEISCIQKFSETDAIDSMNYRRGEGDGGNSGYVQDKTERIACNYMDYYLSAKMDADKMAIGLENLERECALLENYVSLLDAQEAAVIRLYYFERKKWKDVAETLDISIKTAQLRRNTAVFRLCEMFEYRKSLTRN